MILHAVNLNSDSRSLLQKLIPPKVGLNSTLRPAQDMGSIFETNLFKAMFDSLSMIVARFQFNLVLQSV